MDFYKLIMNENLDKKLAVIGIFCSIILFFFLVLKIDRLIFEMVAILSLVSCATWLQIRKNASLNILQYSHNRFYVCLLALFFLLFTLHILVLFYRDNLYERPLAYFYLVSILCVVVALEILHSKGMDNIILFQIVAIGISLFYSQISIFPGQIGIDTWIHERIILKMISIGTVTSSYGNAYTKLPLFHIFVSLAYLITGLDYKACLALSMSSFQIICNTLFTFLLGRHLLNSYKIGLLSSLLLVFSNYHIFFTVNSIPNSFSSIMILPLLYFSLKLKSNIPSLSSILSIILMITIVLSHTITAAFMSIALLISICSFILRTNFSNDSKPPVSFSFYLLFTIFMLGWWTYVSGHISNLGTLIRFGFSKSYFVHIPSNIFQESIELIPFNEQVFNNIGFFIFFALSFIGCFYMISLKYGTINTFVFSIVGLTPLVLGFSSLISQHSIIEQRWWYFSQLLLSIPVAVSILLLTNLFNDRRYKYGLISIIICLLCLSLILSPTANNDNHTFSPNSSIRYSLTSSELQVLESVQKHLKMFSDKTIMTDTYYSSVLIPGPHRVSYDREIYYNNSYLLQKNLVLLRTETIKKPSFVFGSICNSRYDLVSMFNENNHSKIYNCGTVYGYLHLRKV